MKLKELVLEWQQDANGQLSSATTDWSGQPSTGSLVFTALGDYWAESIKVFGNGDYNSPSINTDKIVASNIEPVLLATNLSVLFCDKLLFHFL